MESGNSTLLSAIGGTELGVFTREISGRLCSHWYYVCLDRLACNQFVICCCFLTEAGPMSAPISSTPPTNTLWSSLKYSDTEVARSGSVFLAAHTTE